MDITTLLKNDMINYYDNMFIQSFNQNKLRNYKLFINNPTLN